MKDLFRLFTLHESLALFWSWYVVYLAAIYFPPLLQCKTNTSALEILTEMIRPSPRNFFSQPYAVFNVHTCMEKVNGNVSKSASLRKFEELNTLGMVFLPLPLFVLFPNVKQTETEKFMNLHVHLLIIETRSLF